MSGNGNSNASCHLHNVYKNDPILFKSYVNKRVSITTEDSNVHTGIVYTVDPVSESIILMKPKEEKKYDMQIIMGHAIKSIECSLDSKFILPELFNAAGAQIEPSELIVKKAAVLKMLMENRFPVTEENGVLCIEDTVRIEPPYGIENCKCTNTIILSRIQNLLAP